MSTDDNLDNLAENELDKDIIRHYQKAINKESLRIALEIIGKDEVIPVEELHLGGLSQEYYDKRNKLRAELRKAFEDRYSK